MLKKIKIGIILSGLSLMVSPVFAKEAEGNFKASAEIKNMCLIKANDINFGVVALPLSQQSSSSEMTIRCSNKVGYKVDLTYGGKYFTPGTVNTDGIISYKQSYHIENENGVRYGYRLFNNDNPASSGEVITPEGLTTSLNLGFTMNELGDMNYGDIYCNSTAPGKIGYRTNEAATILNLEPNKKNTWVADNSGFCSGGRINKTVFVSKFGSVNPEIGLMKGAIKGDRLAYKITLPNDSSKTWSKGVNSYNSTGTGVEQKITVNSVILPISSSSLYVSQDVYLDNVTAEVTY